MRTLGIDLGTRKIAVALLEGDELIHALAYEAAADQERDRQLMELGMLAHDQAWAHDADQVWIENTLVGNNVKYSIQLAQVMGAALADLSRLRFQNGLDIRLVNNKEWKKVIVGSGNADKDAVKNYIRGSHPAYAPLCGDDQDLYDASCVALYGLHITDKAEHLTL